MRIIQSMNCSPGGTPSILVSTAMVSSWAKSLTTSPPPRAASAAARARALSRMNGSKAAIRLGRKYGISTSRCSLCCGGSEVSGGRNSPPADSSGPATSTARDENRSPSRATSRIVS